MRFADPANHEATNPAARQALVARIATQFSWRARLAEKSMLLRDGWSEAEVEEEAANGERTESDGEGEQR